VHHIDVWRMDDGAVVQLYPWKDEGKQEVVLGYQVISTARSCPSILTAESKP
jgi:hypothetical protein